MLQATESEILQQFKETFSKQNSQGNTATALEHVECPRAVVESSVSACSHSVVGELAVIGDYEPTSVVMCHIVDAPTMEILITSLRYLASTFSVARGTNCTLEHFACFIQNCPKMPRQAK